MSFYSNINDAFHDPDQEKIDKMAHDMNNNNKLNYYSSSLKGNGSFASVDPSVSRYSGLKSKDVNLESRNGQNSSSFYGTQGDFRSNNQTLTGVQPRNFSFDDHSNKYSNLKMHGVKEMDYDAQNLKNDNFDTRNFKESQTKCHGYSKQNPFEKHANNIKNKEMWNEYNDTYYNDDYLEYDEDKFNEIRKIPKKKECEFTLEHIYSCKKCKKLLKMITKGKDTFNMKDIVILFLIGIIIIIVMNIITNIYLKNN